MGMGMLFAGALTGAAKGLGDLADSAIKREDEERKRATSIMDRRDELLYEMELKSRMAREQEQADAEGYVAASERGKAIGDERRFAKFREDIIRASGGGEGLDESDIQRMFKEQGSSDKRYVEPESAASRDALQAARRNGASGAVLKALDAEHKGMLQAERQAKVDADREAREELRYKRQLERDEMIFGRRKELQGDRIAAQAARVGGSGASDKPIRFDDAQKAELAPLKRDMEKAADEAAKARPSQRAAAEARAQAARDAYDNKVAEFGGERQKPAAQKSTVKDNQTTNAKAPGTRQTIQSGPHKGKTAEWDGNGWKLVN